MEAVRLPAQPPLADLLERVELAERENPWRSVVELFEVDVHQDERHVAVGSDVDFLHDVPVVVDSRELHRDRVIDCLPAVVPAGQHHVGHHRMAMDVVRNVVHVVIDLDLVLDVDQLDHNPAVVEFGHEATL